MGDVLTPSVARVISIFGDLSMLVGGVVLTVWIVKQLGNRKSHDNPAPWGEVVKQLQSVASSLTLVAERLKNLPTRQEVLGELRTDIRHDIGDKVTPIMLGVSALERGLGDVRGEIRDLRKGT